MNVWVRGAGATNEAVIHVPGSIYWHLSTSTSSGAGDGPGVLWVAKMDRM